MCASSHRCWCQPWAAAQRPDSHDRMHFVVTQVVSVHYTRHRVACGMVRLSRLHVCVPASCQHDSDHFITHPWTRAIALTPPRGFRSFHVVRARASMSTYLDSLSTAFFRRRYGTLLSPTSCSSSGVRAVGDRTLRLRQSLRGEGLARRSRLGSRHSALERYSGSR